MNKYNTKEPGNCELLMTRKIRHHMNWQEITDKMKKGILRTDIGTIVSCNLTNGTSAKFVVTDVTDQYVRFETKNFIGDEVEWNENDSNNGGYPDSYIRGYIDTTIWNLLPKDLQAIIRDVDRKWKDRNGNCSTYTTKLFLPTASEMFDEYNCYGDKGLYKQLDFYKEARNRIRVDEDGDTRCYWLASVKNGSSEDACTVLGNGRDREWSTSSLFRVPVCFQISCMTEEHNLNLD